MYLELKFGTSVAREEHADFVTSPAGLSATSIVAVTDHAHSLSQPLWECVRASLSHPQLYQPSRCQFDERLHFAYARPLHLTDFGARVPIARGGCHKLMASVIRDWIPFHLAMAATASKRALLPHVCSRATTARGSYRHAS